MINLNFEKLFLVKDSEYGTHVTYICYFPKEIYLNFYTDCEDLIDIINEINFYIKNRKEIKK